MPPSPVSAETVDCVVVGAGSAGCVLAGRLSEEPSCRVVLLEAGPRDNYFWIHVPIGYGKTMFHPRYNWGLYTEPDAGVNGRKVYWPSGRGLGGSSSINGLIFIRGQPDDYDRWEAAGNPGWSWKDVLPYFRRSEGNERGESELHGGNGPLRASNIRARHELVEAFIRGAQELGVPRNDDFNGPRQEGVGYYQLTTDRGYRCSAAVAYLRPARRRPNLRIETGAHVGRVLFDGGRAVGVEYEQAGKRTELRAREVILAAGALHSPKILQLSGVGPASLLGSHGIPVVVDAPRVGENLQDHLQFRLMFKCTKPITTNDQLASLWGKARIGAQWLAFRSGPLAIGINQGGLFTRVLPESTTPDIQFHLATLSAELAGAKVHPWSGFTLSVCQLRPTSRGRLAIRSGDPTDPPAIHPGYLSTEADRRCALAAIRFARRLAGTNAMRPYVASEYRPGEQAHTDDELLGFARDYGATIFHPAGTCAMGPGDRDVVDARLRVRGLEGLRVVDASVIPSLPSGNTHWPVVMIAEKASDMIREDLRRR